MKKKSRKYTEALSKIEKGKLYSIEEATKLVKETSTSKFDGSVEIAVRLNLDVKKNDQQLRGAIVLPHGTGKTKKVLVLAKGDAAKAATEAGADYVGDVDLITKIDKENWLDFDVIIATPEMMPLLGRLGKVLGPKGLMPNPKTGTVTPNIGAAVKEIKNGKIEYRTDKEGNMHIMLGKVSFSNEDLAENVQTVIDTVIRVKPAAQKGTYIKKAVLHSVMGPAIHLAI